MHAARIQVLVGTASLFLLSASAIARTPDPSLHTWVARVAERNDIAHAVAASKFPVQRPIEDPVREEQVLEDKRLQARALGLDPDEVAGEYRQFIEANKLAQHADFQRYHLGTPPPPAPPLDEIRQRIDTVDQGLLEQWQQVAWVRTHPQCGRLLATAIREATTPGDAEAGMVLVRALVGFCRASSR